MGEFSLEIDKEEKLNDINYLEWVSRMESILTLKNYLGLVTETKTEEEPLVSNKIEPRRRQRAVALLRINCIVRMGNEFYSESKKDPVKFWRLAQEYFQPITIQNQTSCLDKIFSTQFADNQIKEVMSSILENTQQLRSLFSGLTIPPEDLIDSVIAIFLQRQEGNKNEQPNQALGSSRNKPNKNQQYSKKEENDYARCLPGWHNPLTKHNESDCNFLKLDKNKNKPIKSLAVSSTRIPSNQIILDSGATNSMFNNPALFINLTKTHQNVELADGSTILATGFGNVQVELTHCYLQLKNFLLVKSLAYNLVSLGSIMKPKYKIITLDNKYFYLMDDNNELILNRTYQAGSFEVIHTKPRALESSGELKNHALIVHQAAGHPCTETMTKMYTKLNTENLQCLVCSACKITKSPFKGACPIPQQKLHFVHADVFGLIDQPSSSGYKYFLQVVDGFRQFVWTTFLKVKSDVISLLPKIIHIQNQANLKIANFISDNEQNPLAELGNRTTITKERCLLKHSGLNLSYWVKATRTATSLENLTPKKSLQLSTLFQKWYEKEPSYNHLQPFGCQVFYLNNIQKGKFTERGLEGIFLGYEEGHQAYQILDRKTGNVKITHHAKFHPDVFPCPSTSENPPVNYNLLSKSLSDPEPSHDKDLPLAEHSTLIPTSEQEETTPKSSKWYEWILEIQPPPKKFMRCLIQDKFISKILEEFVVEKSRHANNPLPGNIKSFQSLPCKEIYPALFNYQQVVGLLQYLVQCTRPDLAFATSFLSQLLENPKDIHFHAAKHVLTYLKNTSHFILRLSGNILQHNTNNLLGFSNSYWGGAEGYKSFSAYVIYYHGMIGWRSHKQKVVALSSAEAEYNALSGSAQDMEWMRNLILEATSKKIQQLMFTDNQSAISIASNHIYHHGTCDIKFCLHFIRDLIEQKNLKIQYLDRNKMIADSLTKNNPSNKSIEHLNVIFSRQDLSSKGV
ncbi:hypothetical protein O181_005738 [Austropuccinia psidii MF-1]|uniref:Integrase catalytic domain-containing protein n=1 Tax=Austropuccinia psidii MF-1 TaxID=1389203 RepID=A0A9Q3BIU5_9BASI|nr:hypothetical protein [Austropuccinia psidii MF-1]